MSMNEFNWSAPKLDARDIEEWQTSSDDSLVFEDEFDDDTDADELVEQFEFDLQQGLLKKKPEREIKFFVEYDKFTNFIVEITPESKLSPQSAKNGLFVTKQKDIIDRVFDGKIPLSKIYVRHNKNGTKEIAVGQQNLTRSEFDFTFAEHSTLPEVLHIFCDYVMKKITISLDYEKMKEYLSSDNLAESVIEKNNGHFNIFCINRLDRTRLYDKIGINLFELCNVQQIERQCFWLPDDIASVKNIGFVYWNNELPITYSLDLEQESVSISQTYQRPQIVYKQSGSRMLLQSIMKDTNNFKINEEIIFYVYSKYDPTVLIGYKKVNRSNLNNFNQYEIDLRTEHPVRLATDHLHLYLEESDAGTYYKL